MDLDSDDPDPAEADTLGDHTTARRSHGKGKALSDISLPSQKGRLRLRPGVPVVEGYEGKAVSREDVFGREEKQPQGYDRLRERLARDSDDADEVDDVAEASAFSISGDIEKEYSKLMQSEREMAVMRQPSSADIAQKEENAKDLKRQIEMWGALVELRIHLEGALSLGHRLPSGIVAGLFDAADSRMVAQSSAAASEVNQFLGSLMSLQEQMIKHQCPGISTDLGQDVNGVRLEDKVWQMTDERLQATLDWALNIADEWKEHTRLDARRSFKMLDQSLRLQMQAVSDAEPEKLRKRCTPPPGKHAVFGKSVKAVPEAGDPVAGGAAPESADASVGNIFDDRDFYVQLLREVLSSNAGGALSQSAEDKELYAEVQGRRAAKRKARADVERRASKGRKIRYRPIEKLQNFMTGRPRGAFNGQKTAGLEDVEPLSQHACDAMLKSLFAPAKAL
ncbi:BFR2 [Symbiodinium natans]|uniref:BFR2 protein n=1 Tax=Symbiodinium natans TaxID=878477 RepID=A0A812G158_9DINO|nr:BFR2 [Symbiodinium natans]